MSSIGRPVKPLRRRGGRDIEDDIIRACEVLFHRGKKYASREEMTECVEVINKYVEGELSKKDALGELVEITGASWLHADKVLTKVRRKYRLP